MKHTFLVHILLGLLIFTSCKNDAPIIMDEEAEWKLGWRIIESSMQKNHAQAELQFDSLYNAADEISPKFLAYGLQAKRTLKKDEEALKILNAQSEEIKRQLCERESLNNLSACYSIPQEEIENTSLQLELINMFVDDQACRGNMMVDIIEKYDIKPSEITQADGETVDVQNRDRLIEIFEEFGFPTKRMVGKDAMQGIFLMIQHSDGDKSWQKSQLPNIENAVKNGDMDGQSYAYLFDRIQVNSGEKQLYGTQFSKVDPINNVVELAETEDLENLDKRRREIGMMPIEMYKRLMLSNS